MRSQGVSTADTLHKAMTLVLGRTIPKTLTTAWTLPPVPLRRRSGQPLAVRGIYLPRMLEQMTAAPHGIAVGAVGGLCAIKVFWAA